MWAEAERILSYWREKVLLNIEKSDFSPMEQYVSLVWWEGKGEKQIDNNYICKSLDYLSIIFEFKSFTITFIKF